MRRAFAAALTSVLLLIAGPVLALNCVEVKSKVCPLGTFDPNASPYVSPQCDESQTPDAGIADAVQRAFVQATPKIGDELCGLKQIFYIAGDDSWGLWENVRSGQFPTDGRPAGSYIAISSAVIGKGLKLYEDSLLYRLLKPNNPDIERLVEHDVQIGDSRTAADLGLLSVMAHELAHIKWHRDNIASNLACFEETFIESSWHRPSLPVFLRRTWATFGDRSTTEHRKGSGFDVPHHDQPLNAGQIIRIYASPRGSFATALGAASPEEDFVEVYKIVALNNARYASFSLGLKIGGRLIDLKSNRAGTVNAKMGCVAPLIQ